jgi:RNA polymerase sigma-70 factor (ECF subfamily)
MGQFKKDGQIRALRVVGRVEGKVIRLKVIQSRNTCKSTSYRGRPRGTRATEEFHLVGRAKAGDQAAFARLVYPYLRRVYFVALKITRNREDAEDASQQAFLKALAHIGQFRGGSQFSTWLTRIAMNEALMVRRKRRSEDSRFIHGVDFGESTSPETIIRCPDAQHPEALFENGEKRRKLREAIGCLRLRLRVAVHLVGIEEQKCEDAADILSLSQAALKTRFMRARLELRQALANRI